jgi:lipoate-protein ligase B
VERGVSYHGIALNIAPDLTDFELIDPCGMPDVRSTSIAFEAGRPTEAPATAVVERAAWTFARALAAELSAELEIAGDEVEQAPDVVKASAAAPGALS